ncbi:MAG: RNA 2',3'-cyclic phosphodiesterase [Gloeobacterales cyanobacterium]
MRLFIAISLNEVMKERIAAVQQALQACLMENSIRWVKPENLHITLHFLGEQNPDRLWAIQTAMEESAQAHRPFKISLGGLGVFPKWRHPSVLWIGANSEEDHLGRLARDLGVALALKSAPRKFHAHVTLARLKGPIPDLATKVSQVPAQNLGSLLLKSISLMQSQLSADSPQYLELKQVHLRQE